MTKIVHPYAHRLGIIRDWKSRWFAGDKKSYRENIQVDETIRRFLTKRLRGSYTSGIDIERSASELHVILSTARPGIVIGRSGENSVKLRKELSEVVRKIAPEDRRVLKLDVNEIRQAETDAAVVAYMVAEGLEKRMPFRRAIRSAMKDFKEASRRAKLKPREKGIKIEIAGRLNGAEIARSEWVRQGRVPLHTIQADLGYISQRAQTIYGTLGVKIWVCRR